jgi:hypothetical protein
MCSAGTFWNGSECENCPEGWVSQGGSLKCQQCPLGVAAKGSSSICTCSEEHYWVWSDQSIGLCVPINAEEATSRGNDYDVFIIIIIVALIVAFIVFAILGLLLCYERRKKRVAERTKMRVTYHREGDLTMVHDNEGKKKGMVQSADKQVALTGWGGGMFVRGGFRIRYE